MHIHYLQHVPFEGLAGIRDWIERHGHTAAASRLFAGESPPAPDRFDALVVMGGPMGVDDEARYPWLADEKRFLAEIIAADKAVLGVCLGAQLLAQVLGAAVYPNREKEIGWFPVTATDAGRQSRLFGTFPDELEVFHWHGDTFDIPPGALHLAHSAACPHQAFAWQDRVLGLQFHLETTPASARALIDNCSDEIVPAPCIQDAEAMLSEPRRFERINKVLHSILDNLFNV